MRSFMMALSLGAVACAPQSDPFTDAGSGVDAPVEAAVAEEAPVRETHRGWVTLNTIDSTCGDELGARTVRGRVRLDGDDVFIDIRAYPQLHGTLVDGGVVLDGYTTWMNGGEKVACTVEGDASVKKNVVYGLITESLYSPSLDCETSEEFEFEF